MIDIAAVRRQVLTSSEIYGCIAVSKQTVCTLLDALATAQSEAQSLAEILAEARLAIAAEDERIDQGLLRLGRWTPLNVLREKVRAWDKRQT